MRSFNNKNAENLPKIRQLFRISPSDKKEAYKFKERYLYLYSNVSGVKAVKNLLTNGYPEQENDLDDTDSTYGYTTDLEFEISSGCSYCEVDNTVKKLSFVFVVCSKENYKNFNKKDSNLIEDSRRSRTREGLFGNDDYEFEVFEDNLSNFIPAYLIIFEEDNL